jgi:two-component system response regulator LytT
VRSGRKNAQVLFGNIRYVESLGNYIHIHTASGDKILTKENISSIEERLPDHFLRIHSSILVNRDKISSFSWEVLIVEEIELPLSRKYKHDFHAKMA